MSGCYSILKNRGGGCYTTETIKGEGCYTLDIYNPNDEDSSKNPIIRATSLPATPPTIDLKDIGITHILHLHQYGESTIAIIGEYQPPMDINGNYPESYAALMYVEFVLAEKGVFEGKGIRKIRHMSDFGHPNYLQLGPEGYFDEVDYIDAYDNTSQKGPLCIVGGIINNATKVYVDYNMDIVADIPMAPTSSNFAGDHPNDNYEYISTSIKHNSGSEYVRHWRAFNNNNPEIPGPCDDFPIEGGGWIVTSQSNERYHVPETYAHPFTGNEVHVYDHPPLNVYYPSSAEYCSGTWEGSESPYTCDFSRLNYFKYKLANYRDWVVLYYADEDKTFRGFMPKTPFDISNDCVYRHSILDIHSGTEVDFDALRSEGMGIIDSGYDFIGEKEFGAKKLSRSGKFIGALTLSGGGNDFAVINMNSGEYKILDNGSDSAIINGAYITPDGSSILTQIIL